MLYTEPLSFRELDRLMRSVPNFAPRSHGIVLIRKQEYTAKDCDCRYCSHYSGRGRKTGCALDRCDCVTERIIAGAATYRETVIETMSAIRHPPLVRRINQLLKESEETPMNYRNEKHRIVFAETIKHMKRNNKALMAALYLLTADFILWRCVKYAVVNNVICFEQVRLRGTNTNSYPLFCAAKDLYLGTKHLTVSDLADAELIAPKVFTLICNAMAIRRFGLGAIQYKERTAQK